MMGGGRTVEGPLLYIESGVTLLLHCSYPVVTLLLHYVALVKVLLHCCYMFVTHGRRSRPRGPPSAQSNGVSEKRLWCHRCIIIVLLCYRAKIIASE
jgi:hypothetical protein